MLSHQRLAIIDVAGGRQPLRSEDERISLVCNGEIYNHAQLARRLKRDHRFRTRSDSEVLIHLYEELGSACISELDGMFAFVLCDGERVLAARDRLGIKPLYLGRDDHGGTWFASELKALVGVCSELCEFPPGTVFDNFVGWHRWYRPAWVDVPQDPLPPEPDTIAERLEAAVVKRLMSDVPVGVFLSGGLDSSIIAALMRRHLDELHSFSVGIEGSADLEAARFVARQLDTRHHEIVFTPQQAVDALEDVIVHLESFDPALIRSAIPCYFVSKLASEHVKVVLSGEGADEVFAGYDYFGETDDATALHRETVRLLAGLHNLNLQRVDRMTMAHGLEGRVPFLDPEFLDVAMAIAPGEKLHAPKRREKWLLRTAFDGLLADEILWRPKEEFAQGCGSEWTVRDHCERVVSDAELMHAATLFPEDTPTTKEALHYRRLFERMYPGDAPRRTVGRWRGAFGVDKTGGPS